MTARIERHVGATLTPQQVVHGIVFVLARWSPDAVARFDELSEELDRSGYVGRVIVVELDAALDALDFAQRFGLTLHGWGEAFAVSHGRVVARSSAEEGSSLADLVRALVAPNLH